MQKEAMEKLKKQQKNEQRSWSSLVFKVYVFIYETRK
jgi:hypothetical protein